jgi:hypothetical protein
MKTSYLQYILVFSFITTPLLKKYAIKGLNPSNGYIVTHLSYAHPFGLFNLGKIKLTDSNILYCSLLLLNNFTTTIGLYKLIKADTSLTDKIIYINFLKILLNLIGEKIMYKGYLTASDYLGILLYYLALKCFKI